MSELWSKQDIAREFNMTLAAVDHWLQQLRDWGRPLPVAGSKPSFRGGQRANLYDPAVVKVAHGDRMRRQRARKEAAQWVVRPL